MKRTNLPSLFAALSLLSLVTLFMPTQALMASEAASALVPEGQRKTVYSGVGENTSGEETDEGEDDQQPPPESPLTKTRRQLTEQDTYFAAKIRTMTSTTYNLRKELCVANDALAQEKRLTQQQVIRLGELEPLVAIRGCYNHNQNTLRRARSLER